MTIAEYLKRYDIDKHIGKIVKVYRKRRDIAMECIERYFPDNIRYTYPQGGLFTWVELPEEISARDILQKCIERKIAFVPGGSFYPVEHKENTFRLNYSNMPGGSNYKRTSNNRRSVTDIRQSIKVTL